MRKSQSTSMVICDYRICETRQSLLFYIRSRIGSEFRVGLRYRVLAFGRPQSPWRSSRQRAERDAETIGLGSRDEWGDFYLSAEADLEEVHLYELMRRGEVAPSRSTTTPGPESRSARHPV